jgi:hypothetical protein
MFLVGCSILICVWQPPKAMVYFCSLFFPSLNLQRHGGAAVGICVAGVNHHANQRQWQRQQHAGGGSGGGVGNVATK